MGKSPAAIANERRVGNKKRTSQTANSDRARRPSVSKPDRLGATRQIAPEGLHDDDRIGVASGHPEVDCIGRSSAQVLASWGESRTIADNTFILHTFPMRSASFMPIEADLIAANRLHFWTSLKWKQTVLSYVLGGLVFAFIGSLFADWDNAAGIALGATCGLIFWSLLLTGILAVNYALIPLRARRAFQQMKTLQSRTDIKWSPERIQLQSMQGSADFDWRDFERIAQGQHVTLLFQSDYLFNFVPKRALSDDQAADLMSLATSRRG